MPMQFVVKFILTRVNDVYSDGRYNRMRLHRTYELLEVGYSERLPLNVILL